ncbi:hypothetical protein K438DRAFT_1973543 [Mycena galopus ATCC 62051]|nr:hypothetical protein K438DRAFT_1973543 [Mycena galopus ATCC 62051]
MPEAQVTAITSPFRRNVTQIEQRSCAKKITALLAASPAKAALKAKESSMVTKSTVADDVAGEEGKSEDRDGQGEDETDESAETAQMESDPEALRVRQWRHKLQNTFLSNSFPASFTSGIRTPTRTLLSPPLSIVVLILLLPSLMLPSVTSPSAVIQDRQGHATQNAK